VCELKFKTADDSTITWKEFLVTIAHDPPTTSLSPTTSPIIAEKNQSSVRPNAFAQAQYSSRPLSPDLLSSSDYTSM